MSLINSVQYDKYFHNHFAVAIFTGKIQHFSKQNDFSMKKYSVELIGTFFLVFTAVLTTNDPAIAHLAPFAIGAMYMAMIYAGSHISGAHYNPAVTLAAFIRGKIETADAIVYIFFQIMGAASAAAIGVYLHDCGGGAEIVMHANPDPIGSFLAEFLGTFALAYVFLNVSTTQTTAGNSFHGLAIGFAVTAALYAIHNISGGAINPAVVVGGTIAGMFSGGDIWIYLAGTLGGGAAAATVFSGVYGREE